jgi:asparagine synthase (glutamine-hydrolysing)
MCGIYAFVGWDRKGPDAEELGRVCSLMKHRGPDEQNTRILPGAAPYVALAHARLAVIDLETGSQPMCNEDGTVWIVHNGEVYNFNEIRQELEENHEFRTASDTEVIIHAYEEYGLDCVKRFNGPFAFVIWDSREKRVFMARDRLGQKPLYYCNRGGFLVAASTLRALMSTPGVRRELDWTALGLYFTYQYVPSPLTAFRDVRALEPAHYAVVDRHGSGRVRYWRPDFGKKTERSFEESCEELRDVIADAVSLRLISDVPVGAFLSGGIDSSVAVGVMSGRHSSPVRTFSIGFANEKYDERPYASSAARTFRTHHMDFEVGPECIEVLPDLLVHHGQPFADSSALPTYYLSRYTREDVTVALCGDGGDESFAGYDRYAAMRLASAGDYVPSALRRAFRGMLNPILPARSEPRTISGRTRRFLEVCSLDGLDRYLGIIEHLSEDDKRKLLPGAGEAVVRRDLPLSVDFESSTAEGIVERIMEVDLLNYLPDDLMVKADVASMAHGLEVRSPFLDHRVVELAASFPLAWKLTGGVRGTSKRILREAYRAMLPQDILTRGKLGFGIPLALWLRTEWAEWARSVLLSKEARERGVYDTGAVEELIDDHVGERSDNSYKIWNLVCFELWMGDAHGGG